MAILYSVYNDKNLSACITEDYDRAKAIADAEAYYCNRCEEDSEYGPGERDAVLLSYNDETDAESVEEITLTWHAEKDDYDHGRFDYYSSRGCDHGRR